MSEKTSFENSTPSERQVPMRAMALAVFFLLINVSELNANQKDTVLNKLKTTELYGTGNDLGELSAPDSLIDLIFTVMDLAKVKPGEEWMIDIVECFRSDLEQGKITIVSYPDKEEKSAGLSDANTLGINSEQLRKLKDRNGNIKDEGKMPGDAVISLAGLLFHEYIHTKEIRTGTDCESSGGNPNNKEDLNGNPCDCFHSYVYAKQLRLIYTLKCVWPEPDDTPPPPFSAPVWWSKAYDGFAESWKKYRKSCESVGNTNEPDDGRTGKFHPKTAQNPEGLPSNLIGS